MDSLILRSVERWYELKIGVFSVESNEIGQVFHPGGYFYKISDIVVNVYLKRLVLI